MNTASDLKDWFLDWLDDTDGEYDEFEISILRKLRNCTDELPPDFCQHPRLKVPLGATYGAAIYALLADGVEGNNRSGKATRQVG